MTLVLFDGMAAPQSINRIPLGEAQREHRLRDLIFDHPQALPVHELDPSFGRVFTVAREFYVPSVGYIDVLLADERGRLIIVECKLWRNPQARREVVGQILDYARALSRFGYDDLQRQITAATKRQGNVLYAMACDAGTELDEATFVDRVSRDLSAGRFLLLVAGDGIKEGTKRIGEFLEGQPGLAFNFGLIEIAEYWWTDSSGTEVRVVQPRVLAQTAVIERFVIRNDADVVIDDLSAEAAGPPGSEGKGRKIDPELRANWQNFAARLSTELKFDDPSQPPPKNGGLGWMRLPLPASHWITLWRMTTREEAGAYAVLGGSEGKILFSQLLDERQNIDQEFVAAGLPSPEWEQTEKGGTIALAWPAPLPWDGPAEQILLRQFQRVANQLVNSLRPRLQVSVGA